GTLAPGRPSSPTPSPSEERSGSGAWTGPFGFAENWGYKACRDSGLQLLGHRYYDPSTGRFLTRDPIKDGRNWYTYGENDPLTRIDSVGLSGDLYRPIKQLKARGRIVPGTGEEYRDNKEFKRHLHEVSKEYVDKSDDDDDDENQRGGPGSRDGRKAARDVDIAVAELERMLIDEGYGVSPGGAGSDPNDTLRMIGKGLVIVAVVVIVIAGVTASGGTLAPVAGALLITGGVASMPRGGGVPSSS
ncbi:MAG: RHS repeat-associated core domain-containing protein, partial [Fimbriimonadaceae bacterium]|nr:RHS repeat-associated core domain-containing protein [Fimbriimonadaceae bacterium]